MPPRLHQELTEHQRRKVRNDHLRMLRMSQKNLHTRTMRTYGELFQPLMEEIKVAIVKRLAPQVTRKELDALFATLKPCAVGERRAVGHKSGYHLFLAEHIATQDEGDKLAATRAAAVVWSGMDASSKAVYNDRWKIERDRQRVEAREITQLPPGIVFLEPVFREIATVVMAYYGEERVAWVELMDVFRSLRGMRQTRKRRPQAREEGAPLPTVRSGYELFQRENRSRLELSWARKNGEKPMTRTYLISETNKLWNQVKSANRHLPYNERARVLKAAAATNRHAAAPAHVGPLEPELDDESDLEADEIDMLLK